MREGVRVDDTVSVGERVLEPDVVPERDALCDAL